MKQLRYRYRKENQPVGHYGHSKATRRLLADELETGRFFKDDAVLTLGAGIHEMDVFSDAGFTNVTHTNIDQDTPIDARTLPFPADTFDIVFTEGTLHHLDKPHQAIYEMVRVSRRSIVICETQDNFLMRLLLWIGIAENYEVSAVRTHGGRSGGLNGTDIPNYVYRWRSGELDKVFKALNPVKPAWVRVVYEWDNYGAGGIIGDLVCRMGNFFMPKFGNCFALHYDKTKGTLFPWLSETRQGIVFREKYS